MAEIKKHWYKELVVYQIWPRSFCDGNGDGIGDLRGIISKLDYIKSLGANAIWLSPIYKSPQKDYGYDIADYRSIAPEYGTMDDFKELLDTAHQKGLRIIMDLVINHTSDQHEWFLKSKDKNSPYHDYYIWRKGKGRNGKQPPNNWLATFPGPAWEYVPEVGEYYLHLFAVEQPDLNMDNPRVREEVKDIMRFWLDMGVDGFREDVITFISKAEGLPDGFPAMPVARGIEHYRKGPHLQEYLKEFRAVLDEYDCMTVGEAPMMTPDLALEFITEGEDQVLNMMFHFQHMEADSLFISWLRRPFSLKKLKKVYRNWQSKLYGKAWNANYLENHDQPRIIDRYGSLKFREESAKMLATMYICQGGTPFIYQGQEIGMTNICLPELDMYEDVSTRNTYKLMRSLGFSHKNVMKRAMYASRDNARTPVQWSNEKNAGFTSAEKPWFHINPNYTQINVAAAEQDPNSILHYYRKLLRVRSENPVFIYGDYQEHDTGSESLFVYERNYEGKRLLVVCSFAEHSVNFVAPKGFDLQEGELLLSNYVQNAQSGNSILLRPYESRVYAF